MRALFINEKFIQDSDPVRDLNIGYGKFRNLKPGDALICIKDISPAKKGNALFIYKIKINNNSLALTVIPFTDKPTKNIKNIIEECQRKDKFPTFVTWELNFSFKNLKDYFKIIKVKTLLNELLNEKFTQDSDPVRDLKIGIYQKIKNIAAEFKDHTLCSTVYDNLIGKFLNKKEDSYFFIHEQNKNSFVRLIYQTILNFAVKIKNNEEINSNKIFQDVCNEELTLQQISWLKSHDKFTMADENFIIKTAIKVLKKYYISVDYNQIKQPLNEKFTQDSDPIQDLGIGIVSQLEKCVEKIFDIDLEKEIVTGVSQYGNLNHIRINRNIFGFEFYSNDYRYWRGKPFDKKNIVNIY